jgi:phosphatidylserine decarboxylase
VALAREGVVPVATAAFMTCGAWFASSLLGVILGTCTIFLAWFYREPRVSIPRDPLVFVSPASGKVVEIMDVDDPFVGRSAKIGIFMSVADVHVNRIPYDGKISFLKYKQGKHLVAFAPKSSEVNERLYAGLETKYGNVLLVQIAGLVARRIACRVKTGQLVSKGEAYGMIKFGSRVDVYLPPIVKPVVKIGDKVKAGSSVIGHVFKNEGK